MAKAGFAFANDLQGLRRSYGPAAFPDPVNFVEVQTAYAAAARLKPPQQQDQQYHQYQQNQQQQQQPQQRLHGLASVVQAALGKTLDKTMQRSDWARRPLTGMQVEYAALDARVLVDICDLL